MVLRDFVFEDPVIQKSIPRKIREYPMVLVTVVAVVSQHQIRLGGDFSSSKTALIGGGVERKKAVAKLPEDDPLRAGAPPRNNPALRRASLSLDQTAPENTTQSTSRAVL